MYKLDDLNRKATAREYYRVTAVIKQRISIGQNLKATK